MFNSLSPNGYIATLSGDLGNLDMRNPGCIRQGGVILDGSFVAGFDTVYATPGPRSVSVTVSKCVWTIDPSSPDGIGLVPDAALFTVSSTFTVEPFRRPRPHTHADAHPNAHRCKPCSWTRLNRPSTAWPAAVLHLYVAIR